MNGLPMGWLKASRLIRLTLTRDLLRHRRPPGRPHLPTKAMLQASSPNVSDFFNSLLGLDQMRPA
jgi:hypothetical protein